MRRGQWRFLELAGRTRSRRGGSGPCRDRRCGRAARFAGRSRRFGSRRRHRVRLRLVGGCDRGASRRKDIRDLLGNVGGLLMGTARVGPLAQLRQHLTQRQIHRLRVMFARRGEETCRREPPELAKWDPRATLRQLSENEAQRNRNLDTRNISDGLDGLELSWQQIHDAKKRYANLPGVRHAVLVGSRVARRGLSNADGGNGGRRPGGDSRGAPAVAAGVGGGAGRVRGGGWGMGVGMC